MDWVSDKDTGLLGIESLALDPSAPNKLYLTAGIAYHNGGASAILKSDDYGQSFQRIDVSSQFKFHGNGMGRGNGEKLQVDPANGKILYLGTRANGLFRSVDEGLTWSRLDGLDVTTTDNGNGISFVLLDQGRIFVGVSRFGDNMYMSADGGKTFAPMRGGPAGLMPHRAVVTGGKLVATFALGGGPHADKAKGETLDAGGVWQYDIASGKWADISPPLNRAYAGITVAPDNPLRMVVSTISWYQMRGGIGDQFFETLDGGKNWKSIVANGVQIDPNGVSWIGGSFIHWAASIAFDPFDSKRLWTVSGNGVFVSEDIHAEKPVWKFEAAGLEESVPLNLVSIPGGPVISAIGDYDGFRHTDLTRYAPIHTPTMGTTWGLDFAARNPAVVVRAGSAMYISKDMGVSWHKTASMNGKQGQVAVSADGRVIVHCPEKSTTCYRSQDDGAIWSVVSGLHVERGRPVADPVNARKFYALAGERMLVSVDGGASFAAPADGVAATSARLPSARGSKVVRLVPGREGDVWVALYDGGLARSTDSGASFALLKGVSYAAAVGFGKAAPATDFPAVYLWGEVGGVRGAFRSTDAGATWLRINDNQHQYGGPGDAQFILGDMNTFGNVFMSTAGRGIVFGQPRKQ